MRWLSGAVVLGVAACGAFKEAGPIAPDADAGPTGRGAVVGDAAGIVPDDASSAVADGAATGLDAAGSRGGGGPRGALPTGYCCQTDAQCRYRHCMDGACADECSNDGFCEAGAVRYACARPDGGGFFGLCRPRVGETPACIPGEGFRHGAKTLGDCCTRTGDGTGGWECEGGLCTAIGSGPLVCSHFCETPADCAGPFRCQAMGGYRACIPANTPYVCK